MKQSVPVWSPDCNGSIHVQPTQESVTSDAGVLLLRQALDTSGVIEALSQQLQDQRNPLYVQHPLSRQLRTVLLQRAMGWFDLSDTPLLDNDPLWRLACSDARGLAPLEDTSPSQPTLSRLITCLSRAPNLESLHEAVLRMAVWRLNSLPRVAPFTSSPTVIDIDGLPIEVMGHQGGSDYNGYAGTRIYSPLIASIAETGDMLGGLLRPGNAGTATGAAEWIPHLIERLTAHTGCDVAQFQVRIDAGFTDGATLSALEAHHITYLGRLKSNEVLNRMAAPYLTRPAGRPPNELREWYHELTYRAGSWETPRRVILVVKEKEQKKPEDKPFDTFFLVTNLARRHYPPHQVLALYRRRGKAEAHMGELKSALNVHLSSTDRGTLTVQEVMARNQVHLLLNLMAYQILHGLRGLMERRTGHGMRLVTLREQVLKVGAIVKISARQIRVCLGAAADKGWRRMLLSIPSLRPHPG